MSSARLLSVDFEIFGKVQGVFFRKFTQQTATKHGLVGWVQNTKRGTVIGHIQGDEEKVRLMKKWLQTTGSPMSSITKCVFQNEQMITKLELSSFGIVGF